MTVTKRIESIDLLRGVVMLIMTMDHARFFFFMAHPLSDPMHLDGLEPGLFFSRWLTHFCAPVFVFLTGVSAYLYGQKQGCTRRELSLFLFKRGLLLIFLEATVINFVWTFSLPQTVLYFQVIWAIGFSMVCLSLLIHLPQWIIITVGVAITFGHNLLGPISFPVDTIPGILWAFLHDRNVIAITETLFLRTSYPALAWVGVIALGYAAGQLFRLNNGAQRRKWLISLGGAAILLFLFLRSLNLYGDDNLFDAGSTGIMAVMSFFNLTKYPPSLLFLLMTLGPSLIWLAISERWHNRITAFIIKFGKVPFFYYVLHLYVLHLAYRFTAMMHGYNWDLSPNDSTLPYRYSLESVPEFWGVAILTVLALYPLVSWFVLLKQRKSWSVLSYL